VQAQDESQVAGEEVDALRTELRNLVEQLGAAPEPNK
jgi:hypothetical protein